MYNGTEPPDVSRQLLLFFRARHLDAILTHTDGRAVLLFNLEKFTAPQFFSALMKEVSDSVFSGNALIGIGLCYDNLTAVSQSYKEALWAITDPKRQGEQQIVCYSQPDGTDFYGYADFQEALYAHDYAAAEASLSALCTDPHSEAWPVSKLEYVFSPVTDIERLCSDGANRLRSRFSECVRRYFVYIG